MSKYLKDSILQAQKKADLLLNDVGVNEAPIDIKKICNYLHLKIVEIDFNNDQVSGLLKLKNKLGEPVIAVNKDHHKHRQNFTIAHEIGHFVLHNVQELHVDVDNVDKMYFRDEKSSLATNLKEIQANKFAAELLMPTEMLKTDLRNMIAHSKMDNSDSIIASLADKYEVSKQAMLIRIGSLLA